MKIRNKILLFLMIILMLSGTVITAIWYASSRNLSNLYLKNVSESTMLDAYHAFEYLLTDTSYMATLIATNEHNIVDAVNNLNHSEIKVNGQWNMEYLDNRRVIMDYIKGLNGYKYYISGIAVAANRECIFSTNYIIQDKEELYTKILELDQNQLKRNMVMMEPFHLDGLKSTVSSDYVVPAVRAVIDGSGEAIGYVILYFDYGVIDQMFSANLPEGSCFQVVNEQGALIFSNYGRKLDHMEELGRDYVYNTFTAENVGWTFSMAIPSDFYISEIQRTALLTGGVVAVIFLLSGLVLVVIISRITGRISSLSDRMGMVSKGDMKAFYEVQGRDEISQMGHAYNHMLIHIQKLMDKAAEEERQKRLNEIAFLQAQINPHFISNVLNNVVWMAKIKHADNLVPLVNSLNSLLQDVMHQEEDLILLKSELEYVDNYLTLMEYSGNYDFYVEKEIEENTENLYIPRFILQPIIENSIYHGLPGDLSKRGRILIRTQIEGAVLTIIVEDNGDGMNQDELRNLLKEPEQNRSSFNGIGVPNVNERIHLFFGEDYGLRYESEPGCFTRCIFTLPVVKEREHGKNQDRIGG